MRFWIGFAKMQNVVAGPEKYMGKLGQLHNKRVATKYPQIARDYLKIRGESPLR